MDDLVIESQDLGKQYHLHSSNHFHTLRDTWSALFTQLGHRLTGQNKTCEGHGTIWALRHVSFEVRRGDVCGIIGRNGSGKSTLLKILSRITEPTEGQVTIRGRIGSLLEVGTGFHPELTGRENVYLNGAILGMKRHEIARQFDAIIAFAEIDQFVDTPVKYYSSGMYLRLAFAVAAHLEPEILLVDEVLAVGDVAFQKKCLGKMGDVARMGRTVLFVSHNLGAIVQLCPQSILLNQGRVEMIGKSETVVARYLGTDVAPNTDVHFDPQRNTSEAMFTRLFVADESGVPLATVPVTQPFRLGVQILVRRQIKETDISIRFRNFWGQPLFTVNCSDHLHHLAVFEPGEYLFWIKFPAQFLAPDTYSLLCAIHQPGVKLFDLQDGALCFKVAETGSAMWQYAGQTYGNLLVRLPWELTTPPARAHTSEDHTHIY